MPRRVIRIKDLSYTYPDGTAALKKVSFDVYQGESVALIGPNGAGKSTLLLHLNGVLKSRHEEVEVMGLDLAETKNLREIRRKVGLVFQNPEDQLFTPAVFDDVAFGPINMDLPEDEVRERVKEALAQVDMLGYEERVPHHLSLGEKKKVAIATALSMHPEILALDEPTANLDSKSRRELARVLNQLHNEQHITLIVATHDVNFVPLVANKVYVMDQGKIVAHGSVRDILLSTSIMKAANLEPPPIAHLFNLLKEQKCVDMDSLPLTVEEALSHLRRSLNLGAEVSAKR